MWCFLLPPRKFWELYFQKYHDYCWKRIFRKTMTISGMVLDKNHIRCVVRSYQYLQAIHYKLWICVLFYTTIWKRMQIGSVAPCILNLGSRQRIYVLASYPHQFANGENPPAPIEWETDLGTRGDLDRSERSKIFCPYRKSKHDPFIAQLVAYRLYSSRYPTFLIN